MIVKKIRNQKTGSTKAARVAGVANYIVGPQHGHSVEKCIHHEANNFFTDTHEGHVAEMIALAQDAVRSKDPIDHWVLSWAPNERPSVDQVREAVGLFLGHCGLSGHQVIWGLHDDTEHLHVHIAINRVHPETLKVIEINKGFQLNAAHQAIALIEKKQGWQSVENARYQTNEQGELVTDRTTQLPKVNKDKSKPLEPTGFARDREIQTGQKSAQRIGIEQAAPIIANATSWKQLHEALATVGIEYRRDGSGAKLFIGETAVKASDVVDRKNNFGALQKRLGLYQPAHQPELKHDPHGRQTLIDNPIINPYEQNAEPTGFDTFDTLRILSRRDLDVTNPYNKGKTKVENFLQFDESTDHGRAIGMRRGSDRHRAEGGARSQSAGVVLVQPLGPQQPGWHEYIAIRDARKAAKALDTLGLQKRHGDERAALAQTLKAERSSLLAGDWKGNGAAKNLLVSFTATQQAAQRLELLAQHKAERQALQARYKPLPMYRQWKDQPQIVSLHVLPASERRPVASTSPVASTLRFLTSTVDARQHITYQLFRKDVFRDEGRTIAILDLNSEAGIAAALALGQEKFGNVLTLTGSAAFQHNAVALAVANGLSCRFADPSLDKLREILQQQKYQAQQDARQAERDRAAAEQLEKSKVLEKQPPVPLHSPSNNRGEAVSLDSEPQTLYPAPEAQPIELELDMKGLVTDRERELVQRIDAAIKANDGAELEACMNTFGSIRNEAARALGAVAPQEINRAAIEHQVKTEQNTTALKRGHPEPWYLSGIGSITSVCAWDAIAINKAAERDAHAKTPQPEGMFKGAERKAWDQHNADLSGKAEDWLTAAEGLKRELALTTEQRMPKEAATVAAQNAKNAPEHATQLERCEALTVAEKRLEAALRPHKEKKQRELGKSQGR